MLIEEWKSINEHYKISTLGRLQKDGEEVILKSLSNNGYLVVIIDKKIKRIASLVAEAFLPKIEGKNQVNHIDGIKLNNLFANLEWVSNQENNSVEKKMNRNVKSIRVKDLNTGNVFKSMNECSKYFGVNESTVRGVVHGYRNSVKGHKLVLWQ